MKFKKIHFKVFLIVLTYGVLYASFSLWNGSEQIIQEDSIRKVRVKEVIDGDTIRLWGGDSVRFQGIDTPEARDSHKLDRDSMRLGLSKPTIIKMGIKSTRVLRVLITPGSQVLLKYDSHTQESNHKDAYGRWLAYVYIRKDRLEQEQLREPKWEGTELIYQDKYGQEWINVNAIMVYYGYARVYRRFPSDIQEELSDLESTACEQKRGLWASGLRF